MARNDPSGGEDARPRPGVAQPRSGEVSGVRRLPASVAWQKIAAPLKKRDGIRVVVLGVTGTGKTTGAKDLLRYVMARHLVELTLIHDVKKAQPQYDGEIIHEATTVYTQPPEGYPAVRVLRKRDLDHMPSIDKAARVVLETGYDGISSLLVVDEFSRALTEGGKFEGQSVRKLFSEGLGLHASIVALKQLPQGTPKEATGQAARVYFRLPREGTNHLYDERQVTKEHADLIARLGVGEFTLIPQESDWDEVIYQVPAP